MANPTVQSVHVNAPLTNISVAYIQKAEHFVADKVFPNVPVKKQSDRYYTYDRGYFNRDEMAIRAPGTESAGGHYKVDNTPTYFCDVWAFHHDIPDERRANADTVLEVDREATILCTQKGLIKKEREFASNYFTTGVWTTDITGVSGTPGAGETKQWNDAASTPIEDIRAAKTVVLKSTGFEPNTLTINQEVYDALMDHPDIVDRIKYGQTPGGPADVTTADLAQLFKVKKVLVMKAIYNTAAEGATNSHTFIGGKAALLSYAPETPGIMTPAAGYTFSWSGLMGAGAYGTVISKMRAPLIKSDRVEIEMAMDHKVVSADLGYFFTTIVA
jgi:hypothetical protein